VDNFQIGYIFLANIIASYLLTLLSPDYVYLNWKIDTDLWKRMMRMECLSWWQESLAINEQFDKILCQIIAG
jgi:hypothetical protein